MERQSCIKKPTSHLRNHTYFSAILAFVLLLSCSLSSNAQILTFEFSALAGDEATANSNYNDANLSSSTISRGAGLTASTNANRFNATSWATGSIANAVTGNDYMEFTITPNAGYQFSVSSIVIQLQRSATGNTVLALRSSVDGYATDLDAQKAVTDNTTTQTFTFTFAQANSTSAVTYRLYSYAEATTGTGGPGDYVPGDDIIVNGTVTPNTPTPTLTTAPIALSGFSYIFGSGPSTSQSYNLSGANLTGFPGNITVTAPTNYEVSTDGTNFFASRTVAYGSATLAATPIYVRLKSGLAVGAYDGELISNAGGGATTVNVTCDGDVFGPTITVSPASLIGMDYFFGSGPSSSQSYSLSGTNLSPAAGNVTVTAPANYEISTDNSTFAASLNIPYVANTLASTNIYVRLKAGLAIGTYNGELVANAGGSATTVNVSCSGEVKVVSASCATDLIISEYYEGSGNEKYIEIYNGTGVSVNLANYKLQLYTNGSGTASSDITLAGTLPDGAVMVYKNSLATNYPAATNNAACGFNGDDAIALYKISTSSYVDIIGRIGEDPGTAWTSGSHSTLDKTLVRNANVFNGITSNPAAGFPTLASEWTLYNLDDFSHLGSHTMTCVSNTITTGLVSSPPYTVTCVASTNGTVAFTSTNTFSGNTYTAQLSNAAGSFAAPVNIGTLVSDANSGTINITIPAATPTGAGYRIRIVSSNPAVIGTSSASFSITLSGGPCTCFEIESILVDACDAGNEGRNEMFRFVVGDAPINTADITVTWPNPANSWQGICQNASTASTVAAINSTITGGGIILEPPGGILPVGAQVMFFTNTNFNYSMFDFSTLNYTLYAIFQCPDNLPGHFVNYNATNPTNRTLTMNVASCGSDAVTYNAYYIYNGDGATVDFDPPGNPTYSSSGNCNTVPIFPVPIDLVYFDADCIGDKVELKWITLSESNNDYFSVESSYNAMDFFTVARIDGAGNSNERLDYRIVLDDPANYYRLKQTDFDGKFSFSSVKSVNCQENNIVVFPTISTEGTPISIIGNVNHIQIFDVMGNSVNTEILNQQVCCLPAGMYFFVINNQWTFKIVIQ